MFSQIPFLVLLHVLWRNHILNLKISKIDSFSKFKKSTKILNTSLCLRTMLACKLLFILQYFHQSIANLSLHYSTLYCSLNQSTTTDGNSKELQGIPQSSSKSPLARLLDLILAITYVNFKTVMTKYQCGQGTRMPP